MYATDDKGQKLSFRAEILDNAVDDADVVLNDLVRTMIEKGQSDGEVSFKVHVHLDTDMIDGKYVVVPSFKHEASSVLKITAKLNGESGLETQAAWSDDVGGILLRRINDGQTNIYEDYEYEDEEP